MPLTELVRIAGVRWTVERPTRPGRPTAAGSPKKDVNDIDKGEALIPLIHSEICRLFTSRLTRVHPQNSSSTGLTGAATTRPSPAPVTIRDEPNTSLDHGASREY